MSKKFSFFYSLCKNKIFIKFIIEFLQVLYKHKVSIISIFIFSLLNIVFAYIYFNFNYLPLSSEPIPYISLIGTIPILLTIILTLSILGILFLITGLLLGLLHLIEILPFFLKIFLATLSLMIYQLIRNNIDKIVIKIIFIIFLLSKEIKVITQNFFKLRKLFKSTCVVRNSFYFFILLDLLSLLFINQNKLNLFLILSLISFFTLISIDIFVIYLTNNLDKLKTKSIDGNLILMTIHISLVFGFFLLTLFKKFLFPQGDILFKR